MPDDNKPKAQVKQVYLNSVVLMGRVSMNPDLRYTPSGMAVMELRVAANKRYQNKETQEWTDRPTYVGVTVWGQQAERLKERLHRGSPVLVTGELTYREWEKDGQKRSVVGINARAVQDMERHPDSGEATHEQRQEQAEQPAEEPAGDEPLSDIPF